MPFPESDRVVFGRNPLEEVVCQLRFPPLLRISTEEPAAFQEAIRDRYPLYVRDNPGPPPELSEALARLGVTPSFESLNHRFLTEDEAEGVSLTRDFVAVWSRRYHRWEEFRAQIERIMNTLQDVYAPSFYNRVGLRYQDVISRKAIDLPEATWAELLNSSLLGLLGDDNLATRVGECGTQVAIALDEPVESFARVRHGLAEQDDDASIVYKVDIDCYSTSRMTNENVLPALNHFNRIAGNFFRWAITPRLREALQPESLGD